MRKRNRKLTRLGDVLSTVNNRRLKKLNQYELWDRWEELVGPTVAEHAQPQSWRRNTLVVTVTNHAWIQELLFLSEELMDNIRRGVPNTRIDGLRFEIGKIEKQAKPPDASEPRSPPPKLTRNEKEFARDTVRPITDDETRETIRHLIERDLANKKSKNSDSSG